MVQLFISLLKSARPRQALKNLAVFAPLIFSGAFFSAEKLTLAFRAFVLFIIMTSSVYLINDIIDLPKDQAHPFKKKRPIASGKLPIPVALFIATVGVILSLSFSILENYFFFLTLLTYFLLQIGYTLFLKNMMIVDVLVIAAGFILRVYAGAIVVNVHMNVWFLLCVVSLALFLAVGKRRAELAILDRENLLRHRQTLTLYTPEILDAYLIMFANSAWIAYALFTFFASPPPVFNRPAILARFPLALAGVNKWLMLTIPIVIYGIMRYLAIIYQGSRAESPERVLLSDKPLLLAVVTWGVLVAGIIYIIGP